MKVKEKQSHGILVKCHPKLFMDNKRLRSRFEINIQTIINLMNKFVHIVMIYTHTYHMASQETYTE